MLYFDKKFHIKNKELKRKINDYKINFNINNEKPGNGDSRPFYYLKLYSRTV